MSAIAAISSAKLHKDTVPTLKGWAVAGGTEIDSRIKAAAIVKWLVEHPEAIPEDKRAAFAEKEADAESKEPDTSDKEPGPPVVTASDIADLRSLLLSVKGQLADVAARTAALEHALPRRPSGGFGYVTGEPQPRHPSPPPDPTPTSPTSIHLRRRSSDRTGDPRAPSPRPSIKPDYTLDTRSKGSHLSSSDSTGVLANPSDRQELLLGGMDARVGC